MFPYIFPLAASMLWPLIDAAKKHSPSRESKNPVGWSMWKCPWRLNPLQNVHANDCQKIIRKKKYSTTKWSRHVLLFKFDSFGFSGAPVARSSFQVFRSTFCSPMPIMKGLKQRLHYEYLLCPQILQGMWPHVFSMGFPLLHCTIGKHLLVLGHSRCVCTIVRTKQWFLHLARCFVEQPLGGTVGRCQGFVFRNTCRRIIVEK